MLQKFPSSLEVNSEREGPKQHLRWVGANREKGRVFRVLAAGLPRGSCSEAQCHRSCRLGSPSVSGTANKATLRFSHTYPSLKCTELLPSNFPFRDLF